MANRPPWGLDSAVTSVDAFVGGKGIIPWFRGRSLLAFLIPIPVYVFIVYGPAFLSPGGGPTWRGWTALLLVIVAVAIQLSYFLQGRIRRGMAWVQLGIVVGLGLGTWFLADPSAREASSGLYRSYYPPLAALAMVVAVPIAKLTIRGGPFRMPDDVGQKFWEAFDAKRVVAPGPEVRLTFLDVVRAVVASLIQTPLHLATPVALAVLVLPAGVLHLGAATATVVALILLTIGNYDRRADAFVKIIRRLFLTGGKLIVTLVVLVIAALRFAGVGYVTTVLDASSGGTVLSFVFSAYALLWLFDFWVKQAELDLLDPLRKGRDALLRRHGGGRILVIPESGTPRPFDPAGLLFRIVDTAQHEGDRALLREQAQRTEERFRTFTVGAGFLFYAAVVGGTYWLSREPQEPGLVAVSSAAASSRAHFNLAEKLTSSTGEPIIMVAASGGGARAALYTAGVLHGLQRLDKLENVVVGSGVSGGSAALAYFAAFRNELIAGDERRWSNMLDVLGAPYIQDVFAGAGEWRIAGGVRLGQLLTESFERRFLALATGRTPRTTLGQVGDLGLIFNTSLCGEGAVSKSRRGDSADAAGGRLVITNLTTEFQREREVDFSGWREDLPFRVVRDPGVSLFAAASLSANFPPVFPNAGVYVGGATSESERRYWVTDGGAVENRGIIELLLALADALKRIDRDRGQETRHLPTVRLVVAEASAFDPDYRSDRGLGAKFGASAQIANGYIRELLASANRLHRRITGEPGERDPVNVVYLPMPDALRAAGTFGTHWMMPPLIPFGAPISASERGETIELESSVVKKLIDGMFSSGFNAEFVRQHIPQDLDALAIIDRLGGAPWTTLEDGITL